MKNYFGFYSGTSTLKNRTLHRGRLMKNNKNLYLIALASLVMVVMLVSITSAMPFAYITNYVNNTTSVIDIANNMLQPPWL